MAVVVAVIVGRERGVFRVFSAQQAGGEWHPGDDRNAGGDRSRQYGIEGLQPEGVQDDLYAGDPRSRNRGECLVCGLDAHPVMGDRTLSYQGVEIVEDGVALDHGARRTMQLHQVEGVRAEVGAGTVGPGPEILHRVVLGHLLEPPTYLGGDENLGMRRREATDDLLTAAVTVDIGSIKDRHARLDRRLKDRRGIRLADISPVGTELPRAEPDR